jgi:hypothetical protein
MKNRILTPTVFFLSLGALCFAGLALAGDRDAGKTAQLLIEKLSRRVNESVIVPLSPETPWTLRFSRVVPMPKERIFFEVPESFTKTDGSLPDRIPFTVFRENLHAKLKNPDLKPQRVVGGTYDPATDKVSLDDPRIEEFIAMKKQLARPEQAESQARPQVKPIPHDPSDSDT